MSIITQKWVDIAMPFTGNYGGRLSGAELSRLSGVPQQSASRQLNQMASKGLIDYSVQGRNKLFHFDPSKPGTKGVFEILETHKSLEFRARLPAVSAIVSDLAKCSETVIVFGSYASFRHGKDSDLDVVMLGDCDAQALARIKRASPFQVNEHRASYAEFAAMLKAGNPLALEVMKNHVVFGNVSRMAGIFLGVS